MTMYVVIDTDETRIVLQTLDLDEALNLTNNWPEYKLYSYELNETSL